MRSTRGVGYDLIWERDGASASSEPTGQVSIPVRQAGIEAPVRVHLEVAVPESIESVGNGVMLFGRPEHQSQVDPAMAFRLFRYMADIWSRHRREASLTLSPLSRGRDRLQKRDPRAGPQTVD